MPVANCLTPMSETYEVDVLIADSGCVVEAAGFGLFVLTAMGMPKVCEKLMGLIRACMPVAREATAKMELTMMKAVRTICISGSSDDLAYAVNCFVHDE